MRGVVEVYETIYEDTIITTDEEWRELFHRDIPSYLREKLDGMGLSCTLYHKRDDVPGYEYVANCYADGSHIAVGFDVDYDPEMGEVVLIAIYVKPDTMWSPNQLVYYHEV